jgi:hypothetical protein
VTNHFNHTHAAVIRNPMTYSTTVEIGAIPAGGHIRAFHSSSNTLDSVRRRRRGGGSGGGSRPVEESLSSPDTNNNDASDGDGGRRGVQHRPVQDPLIFRQAASALLDKLERALQPMKAKNDVFIIQRMDGEIGEILKLDLGPKDGFYQLEVSEEECIFQYASPISGHILYCLSASTGEWVGCDDGHLFEGIFVRDLIRQCQGLPNL